MERPRQKEGHQTQGRHGRRLSQAQEAEEVVVVTYNEFLQVVTERHLLTEAGGRSPERYGQSFFNALEVVNSGLANVLRSTPLDPFHQNSVDPRVVYWVEENWEQPLDKVAPLG